MTRRSAALIAAWLLLACATEGPTVEESEGYVGNLKVVPSPFEFPDTVAGCSRSKTMLLENRSETEPLVLTEALPPSGALRLSARFPITLSPGERRGLEIQFAPREAGDGSGTLDFATDEAGGTVFRLPLRAVALAPPESGDSQEIAALDLVFVLDVSTTMNEMASLRTGMQGLFDAIEANDLDVRFGLTTFVNDVIVHRDGEFLDRDAFFSEFDSQLVQGEWVPDGTRPRQLANFDFEENSLTALQRSAREFAFRRGARRYILLMTDATFKEAPGTFSDGSRAYASFSEVTRTLEEEEIRLFAVLDGASGAGIASGYRGRPSLVSATGGTWFELAEVDSGALTLDSLLTGLLTAPACD